MNRKLTLATRRRIEYCHGYFLLGLYREAEEEIEGVDNGEKDAPEVLEVTMTLRYGAGQWQELAEAARRFTQLYPDQEQGWISLGCAVRRVDGVAPARDILLKADPRFGRTSATLNYNLACYYCLLGDLAEARGRLHRAFALSKAFRQEALRDPDLQSMWREIAAKS